MAGAAEAVVAAASSNRVAVVRDLGAVGERLVDPAPLAVAQVVGAAVAVDVAAVLAVVVATEASLALRKRLTVAPCQVAGSACH